ncbi:MAG: RNA polymerase subunit sigma [Bacteroidetes bacterium]|nr:MAG: RNA polymerase subunit sigma [Bacteroidota bacterium]
MPETDESAILRHLKAGNMEQAFTLLLAQYQERLYRHIRKLLIDHHDSDDVLQSTFLKVWGALPGFRADSSIFTWLYRIATNEALSFLKQKKRRAFAPWVDVEAKMADALATDCFFDGDELQLKLQQAVLRLPEKQRLVFNMKYFDELKYEEISEILGSPVGTLKASYHHAVKKIKTALQED